MTSFAFRARSRDGTDQQCCNNGLHLFAPLRFGASARAVVPANDLRTPAQRQAESCANAAAVFTGA